MTEAIQTLNRVLRGCKLDAECVHSHHHRHFAFYDLVLQPGCRISRIKHFINEIALAMRAETAPIVKSIPSKGLVRLQITRSAPEMIRFQDLIASNPAPEGGLPFLFSETDERQALWVDMNQNPHLLVAGSTGSGKSVFLHNLIYNALRREDIELFLVDTKLVEFHQYANEPQVHNVASNYLEALNVLETLCQVMEKRYQLWRQYNFTNLEQCPELFNKILLVIDEAADVLLADQGRMFEKTLIKLAAKSRAAGIHIVLATQRPSADIITGLIKTNFPARLACKVASRMDSQIVLDCPGAENLGGRGDALFKNMAHDLTRLQIALTP